MKQKQEWLAVYASDEEAPNFMEVKSGDIAPGILYRSGSPLKGEQREAKNALAVKAGIKCVINLDDSKSQVDSMSKDEPWYHKLVVEEKVICQPMTFFIPGSSSNESCLRDALRFMIDHEGPYLIHCFAGVDRTGFVAALLEALMGASLKEICKNYLSAFPIDYSDSYRIEYYRKMKNLLTQLKEMAQGENITSVNIQNAAECYLSKTIYLRQDEISNLKNRLKGVKGVLNSEKPSSYSVSNATEDYAKAGKKLKDKLRRTKDMNFVAIDFKTGDLSHKSICSISMVKLLDGKKADTFYSAVKPQELCFKPNLTASDASITEMESIPTFPELWKDKILPYIDNFPLVAHNANLHMGLLLGTLEWYELSNPTLRYFCSLQLARRTWPSVKSYSLTALAQELGITHNTHDTLADAEICGELVLLVADKFRCKSVKYLLSKTEIILRMIKGFETILDEDMQRILIGMGMNPFEPPFVCPLKEELPLAQIDKDFSKWGTINMIKCKPISTDKYFTDEGGSNENSD